MDNSDKILGLYEDAFVRLTGLPFEDGLSDWHVNNKIKFTTGPDALTGLLSAFTEERSNPSDTRYAYVLQRADASEEWLALTLEGRERFHVGEVYHFEGEGTMEPEPIETTPTVVATAGPSGFEEEP